MGYTPEMLQGAIVTGGSWMRVKNIRHNVRMLAPLLIVLFLQACAARDADDSTAGMTVSVALQNVHRCSRISPEIVIADAPRDTDHFDVRLVEYGEEERFFGGGSWPDDGSGVIPEGALTKHYRGPCPPAGKDRKYAFIISAMGKDSVQPTAVRLYHFTQE